jgi:hypothetical protein
MFAVTRTLLNPKFEGYKLDLVSQEDAVARYQLEYEPTQATVSSRSTFSFQEVQSRITHNHLAVCSESGRAIYVDANARVIAIDIDAVSFVQLFILGLYFPWSCYQSRKQSNQPIEFCMNCLFRHGRMSKRLIANILRLLSSHHPWRSFRMVMVRCISCR